MNLQVISTEKLKKAIAIAEQIEELEAQLKKILTDTITPRTMPPGESVGGSVFEGDLDPEDSMRVEDYLKAKGAKPQSGVGSRVGGLAAGKMGADVVRR